MPRSTWPSCSPARAHVREHTARTAAGVAGVLTYLLAALAACANAGASVMQRKADREESFSDNLSIRLDLNLLRKPGWLLGVLGVIVSFLLQAAALSTGPLSVVEPIMVFELPVALLLASAVFHRRLHAREWSAALAITLGLAGLLAVLSPSGGGSTGVSWLAWAIGGGVNLAAIGALVAAARRSGSGSRRAALLGLAGGTTYGLTAALMKGMTNAVNHGGLVRIFLTWQTYAMVATGLLAMFLLQSALNAGPLIAAQPGLTGGDPIVSILWGTLGYAETVRAGVYLIPAAVSAVVIGWGVMRLSRSPLVGTAPDRVTTG